MIPVDTVSHDVVEVIGSDETVIIQVGLDEHVVQFLISQVFSQILGNFLQVIHGELALKLRKCLLLGWGRRR